MKSAKTETAPPIARPARKTGRLNLRMDPALKAMVESAAAVQGTSVSEFCSQSIRHAASATLREAEELQLREEDARVLFDALLRPAKPNPALRRAARAHRARVIGGG